MKIGLDMQSRQTVDSRDRGIGRYSLSLAKAMLRQGTEHSFTILLNDAFAEGVRQVKADFGRDDDDPNVLVYRTLKHSTEWHAEDAWRHEAAKVLRQSSLAWRGFDFVHCTSLFENPTGDASTAWGDVATPTLHGITLYDLIPYAYPDIYLRDPRMRQTYLRKIQEIRRADLLLAISGFSRQEAIERLGLDPVRVVNITGAADDHFQRITVSPDARRSLLDRFGLDRFIMYTGGIDHRKNIERLIYAYATFPNDLRDAYQLVIVCKVQDSQRDALLKLAGAHGLAPGRVVMTGFVSEEDLVRFYNLCDLFVFPSWCEGFGLPVLEAMQCGAPVLAAATSSLPEVVGSEQALFDPYSIEDMARQMTRALQDAEFRARLIEHGTSQAKRFTWDNSARIALDAMEQAHARANQWVEAKTSVVPSASASASKRPRMAFVSPLPPGKSGIAAYSAQLLPFLDAHYDITLICGGDEVSDAYLAANFPIHSPDWLREHAQEFERVVYQFGNSDHHSYMFRLLEEVPGTVVLHDFWLSNILEHLQLTGQEPFIWDEHLHYSHGWPALARRDGPGHDLPVITEYPANRKVIDRSVGVILHSQHSAGLVEHWYGKSMLANVQVVSSQKAVASNVDKAKGKAALGLPVEKPLICSFGFVDATKHSLRLARTFLESEAMRSSDVRLVFVGQNAGGEYGRQMSELIARSGGRISLTGFVSDETYAQFLSAADAAVQLRGVSRGETSAAALDCLAYDVALIFNDNGAFAQIPDSAAMKLPSGFDDAALEQALDQLFAEPDLVMQRRAAGRDYLLHECHPSIVAERYRDAIEHFHRHHAMQWRVRTVDMLAAIDSPASPLSGDCELSVAAVEANFPIAAPQRHFHVDADLASQLDQAGQEVLRGWLVQGDGERRTELVRVTATGHVHDLAAAARIVGTDVIALDSSGMDLKAGDIFLMSAAAACRQRAPGMAVARLVRDVATSGGRLVWYWSDLPPNGSAIARERASHEFLGVLPGSAAIIVGDFASAQRMQQQMQLARGVFAGGYPEILYPEQPHDADIVELRALAEGEVAPGWRKLVVSHGDILAWQSPDVPLRAQGVELHDGCYESGDEDGELVFSSRVPGRDGHFVIKLFGAADPGAEPVRFEIMQRGVH
ncbi:MAG TPA: glycosyltransferase, partial [Burkholderiaceae bacterium]|nr:glycosyltransferase [Burkholderiaceae bacterium]